MARPQSVLCSEVLLYFLYIMILIHTLCNFIALHIHSILSTRHALKFTIQPINHALQIKLLTLQKIQEVYISSEQLHLHKRWLA